MKRLKEYFDLYSARRSRVARGPGGANTPSGIWIALHYVALVLGIIAQTFIESLQTQTSDTVFSVTRFIVALIVAAAIFPAVFKNSIAEAGPNVIQLFVTFAAGIGYKSLIDIKV